MSDLADMALSDCLDGAFHPVATPLFFGHRGPIDSLSQSLNSGRFHHGWIFSGPRGVGKATLAYHLARVLLEKNSFDGTAFLERDGAFDLLGLSEQIRSQKTGRLVSQFAHPDMRILRRSFDPKTKKFFSAIRIDEMRALRDMLHTTPSMGGWRVVLIDAAEDMNEASSNACLKILEEPPARTVFILITKSLGQIPITIRSRCRGVKFHGLGFEDFKSALLQQFEGQGRSLPEDLKIEDLQHLSGGSVRSAYELIEGNGLKFYKLLYKILEGLPTLDGRLLEQFVDGVLRDKSGGDYQVALQLMADMLLRMIKGRAGAFALSSGEARLCDKLIDEGSIDQWLGVWDTMSKQSLQVDEFNLDKKMHLMTSFFNLRTVVRSGRMNLVNAR